MKRAQSGTKAGLEKEDRRMGQNGAWFGIRAASVFLSHAILHAGERENSSLTYMFTVIFSNIL